MTAKPHLARLAVAAAFERDERLRLYPQLVAKQKIAKHVADDDTRFWRAIAAFLGEGAFSWGPRLPDKPWTLLRGAAAEALQRREAACAQAPADRALATRRDDVAEIHALLERLVDAFERPRQAEAAE